MIIVYSFWTFGLYKMSCNIQVPERLTSRRLHVLYLLAFLVYMDLYSCKHFYLLLISIFVINAEN